MTLACPSCGSEYNLDDSRIPASGMPLRCPKCGTTFQVTRQGVVAAPAKPVPLPGLGGARPPPPPPPSVPPQQTGHAVPLPAAGRPASGVAAAPPPPVRQQQAGTAVPLPGSGRPASGVAVASPPPAPQPTGHAVPLPGTGRPASGVANPVAPPLQPGLSAADLFGGGGELPPMDGDNELPEMPPPAEPEGNSEFDASEVDLDETAPAEAMQVPSLDLGSDLGVPVPQMGAPRPPAPPLRPVGSNASALEVLEPAPTRPAPSLGRAGPKRRFQVKRVSGKIFGPFDEDRIVQMLSDGEFAGDESVKSEDGDWQPLTEIPAFAAAAPRPETSAPGDSGPASTGEPSAAPTRDEEGLRRLQQVYGDRMAAMAVVEVIPWQERIQKHMRKIILGAVGLVLLLLGFSLGLTTYGVFGRFLVLGPPHAGGMAGQAVGAVRAGLRVGTYGELKRALGEAVKAHASDPIAVDAAGLLAQAAVALSREAPGEGMAELAAAKVAVAGALRYGPKDPDVVRGQAALAISEGQVANARELLEGLVKKSPKDAESLFLLGLAATDKTQAKGFFKQALGVDPKLGKAELALAEQARLSGELAVALVDAEKAVEIEPGQVRAKLLVRQLEAVSGKPLSAQAIEELRGLAAEPSGLSRAQRAAALALVAAAELRGPHPVDAQKTLKAALEIDARNREALLVQAQMMLAQHHGGEALTALKPIADLAAKDLDVADALAQVQIDQGHYADAIATVAPQLVAHPDSARLNTLKGIASASLGKAEEAEKILVAALKADPELAEAHLALGKLYLNRNQLDRSRAEFDAALAKAPQSSRVHTGFAELLLAQGNREAARTELATAIALDPASAAAHDLLGQLLRQIGQLDAGLAELRVAEKLDSAFPAVHVQIGDLLESREAYGEAVLAYRKATEVNDKDPVAWRLLGRALRETGDFDASLEALRKSANLSSQDSEVHVELALTLLKRTDNPKALVESKSAIEADAKNPNAWRTHGRVQLAIGGNREALAALDKSAELDPSSADTQELRGEALSLSKAFPAAVEAYRKAMVLDPRRAALLLEIGQVQVREKSYADATKSYKAALDHDPPFVEANYLMARAFDEWGKTKDAVKYYELATKLEPQNAMPYRYLGFHFKATNQVKKALTAFQTYLKKKPDADDKEVIAEEIGFLKGE